LTRVSLAAPGPGGQGAIAFDDADQQVEQNLAFRRFKHIEDAALAGERLWIELGVQPLAPAVSRTNRARRSSPLTRRSNSPRDSRRSISRLVCV